MGGGLMAGTVKLPGVGPVKKPVVIAGVGILGGVLVYAYWKRSSAPAATATATTDTSATDPSSGYVQDSTAAGYNMVYPSAYSGTAPYGYDMFGNPLPPPTGAGSNGVYTTNSDWATAAESSLESGGVSLSVSTLAISRVLGGLSVNSAQRDVFMQAIGLLGQPPQGYPQPIKLTDSGSGPSTPPGTVLPAPTGLKVTKTDKYHVWLTWNKVTGADDYRIYRNGAATNIGGTHGTSIEVSGLSPNTTYHFHVRAVDSNGHIGAPSASVAGRTAK